jgi:ABC-type amino acid transport substrate-binding protein
MKRSMVLLLALMAGVLLPARQSVAQQRPPETGANAATIIFDALADGDGRLSRAMTEVAETVRDRGNTRILPIAGRGAFETIRDLLYQRGVDFAVLNSDVIAFNELRNQHVEARRRIRFVTKLFDQKVYLFARSNIASLADLRGRKVAAIGAGSGGHLTGATILALSGVPVAVEGWASPEVIDATAIERLDALFLLSTDLEPQLLGRLAKQFQLLPIPSAGQMQSVYSQAFVEPAEVADIPRNGRIATVSVSTVLATFNWTTTHLRYKSIESFIDVFFAALPELRRRHASSIWQHVAIDSAVPGWVRHSLVQPERALGPKDYAETIKATLRTELASIRALKPPAATPADAASGPSGALRFLAAQRPPLSGEGLPNGGLAVDLLRRSLSQASGGREAKIEMRWAKGEVPALPAAMEDQSLDLVLPWESAECERPNELPRTAAILCDAAIYSSAIIQVVVGVFTLRDAPQRFDQDLDLHGKTLCLAHDRDGGEAALKDRTRFPEKSVTVVTRQTLLDCVSAVQTREADAFVALDIEGRHVLRQIGLQPMFRMLERPLATRGIHAVVPKAHPRAAELIARIDAGLQSFRNSEAYTSTLREHLLPLWSE